MRRVSKNESPKLLWIPVVEIGYVTCQRCWMRPASSDPHGKRACSRA